ncbi:MAG: fibronectin type III domain-containing protein [Actinophytocola sp.]|uniref:fibronectin type III domain-containing protein n=1 Tax=Actinophytocola sp. TaxID=1872138 RepID=UPI003C78DABD
MKTAASKKQHMVIASASWLPGGGEWWATFAVILKNYSDTDVVDPKIKFSFDEPRIIQNNYGLIFDASSSPVTSVEGKLVTERKVIPAGGVQEFSVAMQNGGPGAGSDPGMLPTSFSVDGDDASPPDDDEPPTTPSKVRVTSTTANSISLAWDPSTDNVAVGGYEVDVKPEGGATQSSRTTTPGSTVGGLSPATTYTVQIRAYDISGNLSGYSPAHTAQTTEPLPDMGDWDVRGAPFVDYTAWPNPQLAEYGAQSGLDGYFAGFLVARPGGDKKVYWGGYESLGDATTSDYGKSDFASFQAKGGKVVLSFGGASNVPLEAEQTDVSAIVATYQGILANYKVTHVDFDFEGSFIHDYAAQDRHIAAIGQLLQEQSKLKISYTLPVDGAPGSLVGFNDGGARLLLKLANAGIEPSLINGMLMEFGQTSPPDAYDCCVNALNGMFAQISATFTAWSSAKVWRRIGGCPMFGRHINGKVFTLENQRQLVDFARHHALGTLSGWDATRDHNQGTLPECDNMNGNDVSKCTYVVQPPFGFSKIIATYQPAN